MDAIGERAPGTHADPLRVADRRGRHHAGGRLGAGSVAWVLSVCPRSPVPELGTDPQGLLARTNPRGNGFDGFRRTRAALDWVTHHRLVVDIWASPSITERRPVLTLQWFSQGAGTTVTAVAPGPGARCPSRPDRDVPRSATIFCQRGRSMRRLFPPPVSSAVSISSQEAGRCRFKRSLCLSLICTRQMTYR